MVIYIILVLFFFLSVLRKFLTIENLDQIDIRVLNFLTMFYIIKHYVLGIGLGGLDDFVIKNYDFFLSKFWFASVFYKRMSLATESDIVGVFSMLGLPFGIIFYGINLWICIKAFKYFNKINESLSKFILLLLL